MEGDSDDRRVQARFITKLSPPFVVPSAAIAIPAKVTRLGLSSIVNNLLKAGDPNWTPQPFDFLIYGEFIRVPLDQFILAKGISAERVLEIQYVKAIVPRTEESIMHDDWVSAVDGSCPKLIVTGCYDGFVRVFNTDRSCTHMLGGHSNSITSVNVVNYADDMAVATIATASKDRTLRLWKLDVGVAEKNVTKMSTCKILRGHNASVQCVASLRFRNMLCSGSWDCVINLWHENGPSKEVPVVSVKKRRVKDEAKDSQLEGEPVSSLIGHTQLVSSVVWPKDDTICSASWDHSVKSWDVETGQGKSSITTMNALNCLDVGGEASALIVAGGSDPVLKVWDPRRPGSSAPVYQVSSHTSWISACKWHNHSWLHLLSSSYDGKVMLWDLRTMWPLAIIDSHGGEKVLCADWWKDDCVISGGTDNRLSISSGASMCSG